MSVRVKFFLGYEGELMKTGEILGFVRGEYESLPERVRFLDTKAIVSDFSDGKLHEISVSNLRRS